MGKRHKVVFWNQRLPRLILGPHWVTVRLEDIDSGLLQKLCFDDTGNRMNRF